MNRRRATYLGLATISVVLALAPPAGAAPVTPPPATAPPGMAAQTINNSPGDQLDPHVSGNLISYTDFSSGSGQIRYHDLGSGSDTGIPTNGAIDVLSDVLSGTIVYTHVTSCAQSIYSFDTSTSGPPTELAGPSCPAQGVGVARSNAKIGAATVAWEDLTANPSNAQIVAYDRGTATVTPISDATTPNVQASVSPDGTLIAWSRCDGSLVSCHIWDATRSAPGVWTTRQLTNDAGSDQLPDTNGSVVVYQCTRGGEQDICWQPAAGGTESELAFPGADRDPHVSGHLITFEHFDASAATPNWDLYAYDMSSGVLYRITNTPQDESLNDVWSDPASGATHVAWTVQNSPTGYDVNAATFTLPPPDAPLTITHIAANANRHGDAGAGVTFTDADPNGNLSQYSGTIDWGDGSPATQAHFARNPLGGFAAGGVHQYGAPGTYTVTIAIHDSGGASATRTTTLVVPARTPADR